MWTTAYGQILTLDNLMFRGRPLANCCCLCYCNAESVDHLLLFCPIAHSLWMYMLRLFVMEWVTPGSVVDLLFCWYHWLGKHSSDIWDLVPSCLMQTIWTERNQQSFQDEGKNVVQLLEYCQRTLFDWYSCWGYSDCSTLLDFLSSIRIDQGLLLSFCFFFPLFTTVNILCFFCYSFINNILFLLIQKKKKKQYSHYI